MKFLFDKLKLIFKFRGGKSTKTLVKGNNNNVAGGNININNHITDYVQQLEIELRLARQEKLSHERFNAIEFTYEKAKHQNPNHSSVKTFVNIAKEYYIQRINQSEKNGKNAAAYQEALKRYQE